MRPSHLLRPRYVADRVRLAVHQRLNPGAPWLTAKAIALLDQALQPDHVGVEWGSGRSTLWFADRVKHLLSIEHDPIWHEAISTQIAQCCVENIDYRLIPCEPEREETPQWIVAMFASDYVRAIDEFGPKSLDFALVDGMYRSACALAILPRLKSGGLLIVDNINWFLPSASRAPTSRKPNDSPLSPSWEEFESAVSGWERKWTENGVTDTAIWVVP